MGLRRGLALGHIWQRVCCWAGRAVGPWSCCVHAAISVLAVLGEGLRSLLNAQASLPAEQLLDLSFLHELFSTFTGVRGMSLGALLSGQMPNAGSALNCVSKVGQQDTQ